ncbi:UPF0426 protein At1g28150, chloroplastic isoform X2 [Ricinus communis]|uniref:Uncharacterized protein n=1 Tax=Ricinus communis TaxID=3988 RepID=B9SHL4_RICCO|nr:UPF0426 protein At1g28150, chloroplastic isoform X2 [Ricinus communis]EEF36898.1 conserved hypothetical protein [Ricinus communis]|eukprot:XP_002525483.1 UPF0426 protein At1g28150, chloroplastic isoform X1 [Ricinus communis]
MALCMNTSSCSVKTLRETNLRRLSSSISWLKSRNDGRFLYLGSIKREGSGMKVQASCFFNPTNQPILKEVLKEPVAFLGGMFAGLLRLDLEEEPLKEWVTRTVEASGITVEDIDAAGSKPEEVPQQIDIE